MIELRNNVRDPSMPRWTKVTDYTHRPRPSPYACRPAFFCAFWLLGIQDVYVPRAAYDRELERCRRAVQAVEDNREMVRVCGILVCVCVYCMSV